MNVGKWRAERFAKSRDSDYARAVKCGLINTKIFDSPGIGIRNCVSVISSAILRRLPSCANHIVRKEFEYAIGNDWTGADGSEHGPATDEGRA